MMAERWRITGDKKHRPCRHGDVSKLKTPPKKRRQRLTVVGVSAIKISVLSGIKGLRAEGESFAFPWLREEPDKEEVDTVSSWRRKKNRSDFLEEEAADVGRLILDQPDASVLL